MTIHELLTLITLLRLLAIDSFSTSSWWSRCSSLKPRTPSAAKCILMTSIDCDTIRHSITLLLDFDGTVAETESLFTLSQFNRMFRRKQLNITWDDELYRKLLLVGTSEHRLFHYFDMFNCWPLLVDGYRSDSLEDKQRLCWHLKQCKDEELESILSEVVANTAHNTGWSNPVALTTPALLESSLDSAGHGCLKREPSLCVRPGIFYLINDTIRSNPLNNIAICSNSKTDLVRALMEVLFPPEVLKHVLIFGGNMVGKDRLKPQPDLYLLAARAFNLSADDLRDRTIVIEDTDVGVVAAKAAGIGCVIATKSFFSVNQIFPLASAVVRDLVDLIEVDDKYDIHTEEAIGPSQIERVVSINYLVNNYLPAPTNTSRLNNPH